MWFPVKLQSARAPSGELSAAVIALLEKSPHYLVIEDRKISNRQCDASPVAAAATMGMLEKCSATYIGKVHAEPSVPFCAFTVAERYRQIAYLEHLVYSEPLGETRFGKRWLEMGLHNFIHVLLRDEPSILAVVLPLPIPGDPPSGFEMVQVGERFHIKRKNWIT